MSEVAGRLAPQVGAHSPDAGAGRPRRAHGRRPGVANAAKVVVIGAGVAGQNAAASRSACGPRSCCSTCDIARLRAGGRHYQGALLTVASNADRSSGRSWRPTW